MPEGLRYPTRVELPCGSPRSREIEYEYLSGCDKILKSPDDGRPLAIFMSTAPFVCVMDDHFLVSLSEAEADELASWLPVALAAMRAARRGRDG